MATFSGVLPGPNLSDKDISNIQTLISNDFGQANDAVVSWVLYSEAGHWPTWQTAIVNSGFEKFATGYDGYCLLMGLRFDYLKSAGDMLGLAI